MKRAIASERSLLLAFDTATEVAVVALGDRHGRSLAEDHWPAGHLHGERLLASIGQVLEGTAASLEDVGAIVVGLGPGSFTGLRVGLAVGKGLAFGLDIRLVGIATPVALVAGLPRDAAPAPGRTFVVLQPAGPSGRYRSLVTVGPDGDHALAEAPRFLTGAEEEAGPDEDARLANATVVTLDLPDAPPDAQAAGELARDGLGTALLRLGTDRLAVARPADPRLALAELVPSYVTPPRGTSGAAGEIRWSHDRP